MGATIFWKRVNTTEHSIPAGHRSKLIDRLKHAGLWGSTLSRHEFRTLLAFAAGQDKETCDALENAAAAIEEGALIQISAEY